ncbi:hypothetical protein [Novosphingobium gossypii]|uniref:hypothetical protein n=1 Tax=Novosphingobium gossypii TaxID=1604774 RepID=UPI003D1F2486
MMGPILLPTRTTLYQSKNPDPIAGLSKLALSIRTNGKAFGEMPIEIFSGRSVAAAE